MSDWIFSDFPGNGQKREIDRFNGHLLLISSIGIIQEKLCGKHLKLSKALTLKPCI